MFRRTIVVIGLVLATVAGLPGLLQSSEVLAAEYDGDASSSQVLDNPREFDLRFTHVVENTGKTKVQRQDLYVLLPQDKANQTVTGISFNPEPTEYLTDEWGQRVAHYVIMNMPAKSRLEVGWTARVRVSDLSYAVDPSTVLSLADIPDDIVQTYTQDETRYNIYSPVVQAAAAEAVAGSSSVYEQVRDTYQYVIDHLEYSREGNWDDAATVLARGDGSCTEYVFALIALYRANGIPAQFVGGSRLRADGDYVDTVFHRAVEVYLPGYGWVPMDVTLGDTENDPDGYFLARYGSHFLMSTAGGRSNLLGWNYHSNLKVADASQAEQVSSARSMSWKAVASEPAPATANLAVTMRTVSKVSGRNSFASAVAEIKVVDAAGQPMAGATVSGRWSGLTSDSDTVVTDSKGVAVLQSDQSRKTSGTFTLTVLSVVAEGVTCELQGDTVASISL